MVNARMDKAIDHGCNWNDSDIQGDTKKRELLKNPTKIEEIKEKKY